jgi:galactonate dehydratase
LHSGCAKKLKAAPDYGLRIVKGSCVCGRTVEFFETYRLEERLRTLTTVPLATGERLATKFAFSEICARHLVNYVQPVIVHCGGILEMKKIAALAEAFRIELAPHNPQSEVSTMASLHICMCTPNATILEIGSGQSPFWNDLFFGGSVRFENGFALAPDRPGLGIELDEAVAADYPYEPKDWHARRFRDGSISDR